MQINKSMEYVNFYIYIHIDYIYMHACRPRNRGIEILIKIKAVTPPFAASSNTSDMPLVTCHSEAVR